MNRTTSVFAALGAALSMVSAPSLGHAAPSPLGIWIDHSGRGAVEIKPCGAALCGFVVAVKNESDTKGCGKQIIGGAKASTGDLWDGGWIYSPERRKTYDVELKPLENGTLRVVGFAGIRMFSRTMIWTRAPADMKLCNATQTAAISPAATPAVAPSPAEDTAETTPANTETPAKKEDPAADTATPSSTAPVSTQTETDPVASARTPDQTTDQTSGLADQTAAADTAVDGGPPTPRDGGLDLGGLNLEKILTKTKDGKCKIDLPWVKLTVDCNGG